MRNLVLVVFIFATENLIAQSPFPSAWTGRWKGDLLWYNSPGKVPKTIAMQLNIEKTDTAWSWQLSYGEPGADNRPYSLFPVDSSKGHWAINEHNGIVLDQFFLGDRLTGAFTVGKNMIINSYHLRGDSLVVEFNSLQTAPIAVTGSGTEDSPKVESFFVQSFQRAVLFRK